MAITIYENNAPREIYAFRGTDCYMYTVGLKNNSGKLFQPGTRGRVFDDVSGSTSMPGFIFKQRSSEWIVPDQSTGYFAMWVDSQDTVVQQTNAPYSDTLGLEYGMKHWVDPLNTKWLFPREVTGFSYVVDDTRCGDKPVSGELYNGSGFRFLRATGAVYKFEAHVVVSKTNTYDWYASNWDAIQGVYIPILNFSTSNYLRAECVTVKTERRYRYYQAEFTGNLLQGSGFFYPVIAIRDPNGSTRLQNTAFRVQTKFCLKDD